MEAIAVSISVCDVWLNSILHPQTGFGKTIKILGDVAKAAIPPHRSRPFLDHQGWAQLDDFVRLQILDLLANVTGVNEIEPYFFCALLTNRGTVEMTHHSHRAAIKNRKYVLLLGYRVSPDHIYYQIFVTSYLQTNVQEISHISGYQNSFHVGG